MTTALAGAGLVTVEKRVRVHSIFHLTLAVLFFIIVTLRVISTLVILSLQDGGTWGERLDKLKCAGGAYSTQLSTIQTTAHQLLHQTMPYNSIFMFASPSLFQLNQDFTFNIHT